MRSRTRTRLLSGAVLLGLAVLVVLGWLERDRFQPVEAGRRAPDFAAASLNGDTIALSSLRGKVVLLNLWATWCAPCRWEMPAIQRVYRQLRDQGLEVVALSVDAPLDQLGQIGKLGGDVPAYVKEMGLTFTVLLDPQQVVQHRYGVTGLPTTFLIGRDGRIARKVIGPAEWDEPPHIDYIRQLLRD